MTEQNLDLDLELEKQKFLLKQRLSPVGQRQEEISPGTPPGMLDIRSVPNPNLGGDPTTVVNFTPEGQRILMETGLSAIGSAIPAGAGLAPLLKRMLGSGGGAGLGSLAAEGVDPSANPLQKAAITAGVGAAGEAVGTALIAGGRKLMRPFEKKIKEGVTEANEILAERGASLTPAQASESALVDSAESVAEAGVLSGGGIQDIRSKASRAAISAADDFSENFSAPGTREQAGDLILDSVDNGLESFRDAARELYAQVDRRAGGQFVNIESVQAKAAELLARSEKGLGSDETRALVSRIADRQSEIPFEEAQLLRSDLLGVGRQGNALIAGKAKGAAKELAQSLDGAISDGELGLTADALAAFREANAFWKEGQEKFNNRFIKALIQKDPELVFDAAVKNKRPTTIRRMRSLVGKQNWEKIQGQWLSNWLETSISTETAEVSGVKMITKLQQLGSSAFREMFPDTLVRKRISSLARTVQLAQSKPTFTNLKIGTQIAQASVIFGAASGALPGNTTAVLLGPEAVALLLKSRIGFRWLTEGLRAKPGTAQSIRALTNLNAFFAQENLLPEQQAPPPPAQQAL